MVLQEQKQRSLFLQGGEHFDVVAQVQDPSGMGEKGQDHGLFLTRFFDLVKPFDDLLVPDVHPVKGAYGQDGFGLF